MKNESTIESNTKLLKTIIAIIAGLLTIITLSIGIGVYFGRNAAIVEMIKTENQGKQ